MTARHVMIGGFLGAGKTTALCRLAEHLTGRGLRVGLITNDQSTGLVDTAWLRSRGFEVEEIGGGCFCCRFSSLKEASDRLGRDQVPDVFLAEPVGSCTDLVATVSYPLRRLYGERFKVAPLSVLLDPRRAARVFGLRPGPAFSEKVRYVYRKQVEEAHFIVINKQDQLDPRLREELIAKLEATYPAARVFCVSAREGSGLLPWFEAIERDALPVHPAMQIDYDAYAAGEALLGWLNATFGIQSAAPIDADRLLADLAERLRRRLNQQEIEIAHLKLTLDGGHPLAGLSAISVVDNQACDALRETLGTPLPPFQDGSLIVNLRAEAAPLELSRTLASVVADLCRETPGLRCSSEHEECFRPARPIPEHRIAHPS